MSITEMAETAVEAVNEAVEAVATATAVALLPADVLAIVAPKHEAGIRKDGMEIRKNGEKAKALNVRAGMHLRKAWDATMTLAPSAKSKDEHKAFVASLRATLIDWMGNSPSTGQPYAWNTISNLIKGSRVLDGLSAESQAIVGGIDAAVRIAGIPASEREAFVQEREAAGLTFAPKPLSEAVREYLIDEGHITPPTFSARTKRLVDKWRNDELHVFVLEAVARLNPDGDAAVQDDLNTISDFARAVAGVSGDTDLIAQQATETLLVPSSAVDGG